jgi:integrase
LDFANVRILKWNDLKEVPTPTGNRFIIQTVREKTKRSYGQPLQIPVKKELADHLQSLKRENAYILPDRFRTRNIEGEFPAILKKAKIQADGHKLGFHCWRHTFNSNLQALGVPVDTRRQLTGHSNIDTNLIYSNAVEPLFSAVDKIKSNWQKGEQETKK